MDRTNSRSSTADRLASMVLDGRVIGRATSIDVIVSRLEQCGCTNLTECINLVACSDFAVAGGGFCDVYRGQLHDGRRVAIKSLRVYDGPEFEVDNQRENILKNAAKELYQWSKLQHPNIVPLLGLAQFRGRISMISEWMVNGSLGSFIRLHPDSPRIPFCKDICAGLRYIHEIGMVHCDLKAENVMISSSGVAMITDFGSAQLKDSSLKFTRAAGPVVSFRWATVLEAVTGKIPFEELSDYQIYSWVVTEKKRPPRPDIHIDDDLWILLETCWDQEPKQRPSIVHIYNCLQRLYPHAHSRSRIPELVIPNPEILPYPYTISPSATESQDPVWLHDRSTRSLAQDTLPSNLTELGQVRDEILPDIPTNNSEDMGELNRLGNSYLRRFERLGDLVDINHALEALSQASRLAPKDHPTGIDCLLALGTSYQYRFECLNELADIDKAIECQTRVVSLTPSDNANIHSHLSHLGTMYRWRFERLATLNDIEMAIHYQAQGLKLMPPRHIGKPILLSNLGISHVYRFDHLGRSADFNRAIEYQSGALHHPHDNYHSRPVWLNNLGISYMRRFQRLGELDDVEMAVEYFKEATTHEAGDARTRFTAARQWAATCSLLGVSPEIPYTHAIKIIPQLSFLGITTEERYRLLENVTSLSTEAVSWAILVKDYGRALEWSEAGRFMVWEQIARLRVLILEHTSADPELAATMESIRRELEQVNCRLFGSHSFPLHHSQAKIELWAFERHPESQWRNQLAANWERLLRKARSVPVFEGLMDPYKASELMRAAKHGPVVSITAHSIGCDALIIHQGGDRLAHMPLKGFTRGDAEIVSREYLFRPALPLQSKLSSGVYRGRVQHHYALTHVKPALLFDKALEDLWQFLVKPILDFLGYTKRRLPLEQLPHITWCTTGALALLPLHAAGCYKSPQMPKAYKFVVSSYTPAISVLLSPPSGKPTGGILAVLPDYKNQGSSRNHDALPGAADELATVRWNATTYGIPYLELAGERATIESTLDAMEKHSWVHIACHAVEDEDPMQNALALHDGPLFLSKIITRRPLKNKGLAFLASCYTASENPKLPGEGIHLAAGVLVAGYPSVIAAMWEIRDDDASFVARRVYIELLKHGDSACLSASRALHNAVADLRDRLGENSESFRRWIPFIHIGHD